MLVAGLRAVEEEGAGADEGGGAAGWGEKEEEGGGGGEGGGSGGAEGEGQRVLPRMLVTVKRLVTPHTLSGFDLSAGSVKSPFVVQIV